MERVSRFLFVFLFGFFMSMAVSYATLPTLTQKIDTLKSDISADRTVIATDVSDVASARSPLPGDVSAYAAKAAVVATDIKDKVSKTQLATDKAAEKTAKTKALKDLKALNEAYNNEINGKGNKGVLEIAGYKQLIANERALKAAYLALKPKDTADAAAIHADLVGSGTVTDPSKGSDIYNDRVVKSAKTADNRPYDAKTDPGFKV